MARVITVQPPFTMLVANRNFSSVQQQHVTTADGQRTSHGLLTGTLSPSTATVTVADNDFTAEAILTLGLFTLRSGLEWVVGGSTALSAVALAAAIDNLPDFAAVAVGSDVNITGPASLNGATCVLEVHFRAAIVNFTLSPTTGFMLEGGQTIGSIGIL